MIDNKPINISLSKVEDLISLKKDNRKSIEEVGKEFELIFAKKLVNEMTKNSFDIGGKDAPMNSGNSMYRHHITDTLAKELADQGSLGLADLIKEFGK
ncbi:rod-binding protein [Balneolaceae bacterium]|jgi:Rod binding domain-containing protein|nr:rod-binding protein [Balneolaceae bacterium]